MAPWTTSKPHAFCAQLLSGCTPLFGPRCCSETSRNETDTVRPFRIEQRPSILLFPDPHRVPWPSDHIWPIRQVLAPSIINIAHRCRIAHRQPRLSRTLRKKEARPATASLARFCFIRAMRGTLSRDVFAGRVDMSVYGTVIVALVAEVSPVLLRALTPTMIGTALGSPTSSVCRSEKRPASVSVPGSALLGRQVTR